jgi:hypothetical protein
MVFQGICAQERRGQGVADVCGQEEMALSYTGHSQKPNSNHAPTSTSGSHAEVFGFKRGKQLPILCRSSQIYGWT